MRVKGLGSPEELKDKDDVFHKLVMKLEELLRTFSGKVGGEGSEEVINWGLVVDFLPTYTCVPTTVGAIQHIVRYAREHDLGVRCAGFGHSWAPIFRRDKQILISLLQLEIVDVIPNPTSLPLPEGPPNELQTIEHVTGKPHKRGHALVRVGSSCTNERLRRWCVAEDKWTLPLNVTTVDITIGGSNGPICHDAGIRHSTLSDLVRKVEYVDCNGELRIVEDPRLLKAAAGGFGVMGVVTHLTLELQPMTYALLQPQKVPLVRGVPPPDDLPEDQMPPALRIPLTPDERAADIAAFESHCENDYYSEWFWFPYANKSWLQLLVRRVGSLRCRWLSA